MFLYSCLIILNLIVLCVMFVIVEVMFVVMLVMVRLREILKVRGVVIIFVMVRFLFIILILEYVMDLMERIFVCF